MRLQTGRHACLLLRSLYIMLSALGEHPKLGASSETSNTCQQLEPYERTGSAVISAQASSRLHSQKSRAWTAQIAAYCTAQLSTAHHTRGSRCACAQANKLDLAFTNVPPC